MWFEDYLYDDLDDYVGYLNNPLDRVLERGLTSSKYDYEPYQADMFWKMASSKCVNFDVNLKDIFYNNFSGNLSRSDTVEQVLQDSICNFGSQLGSTKASSLEAALLYYQYATLYKNQISLLDSNEDDSEFKFKGTPYQYKQSDWGEVSEVASTGSINVSKIEESGIPAFGAFSIKIKSDWLTNANLDEGYEAVLNVRGSPPLTVSILSEHSSFTGNSILDGIQHHHFRTDEYTEYVFTQDELVDFFITIVNPNDTHADIASLSFEIRKISDNSNTDTDNDGINDTADPDISDPCVPNLENDACYATAIVKSVLSSPSVVTVDQEVVFTIKGENLPLGMIVTPEGSDTCTAVGTISSSVQMHQCVPKLAGDSIDLNMIGRFGGDPLQRTPVKITVNVEASIPAPTNVVATANEGTINLTWDVPIPVANGALSTYTVYVSTDNPFSADSNGVEKYTVSALSGTSFPYEDGVLGKNYFFAVTRTVGGVESELSTIVSASLQAPEPDVDADADGTQASIDLNDNIPCIPNRDLEVCRAFGTVADIKLSPEVPEVGDNITFTVLGSYLPDDLVLEISASSLCQYQGIAQRSFEAQQFFCLSVTPTGAVGSDLSVRVGRQGGEELGSRTVSFSTPALVAQLTGLSANTETLRVGEPVVFTITGENLPSTIAVSLQGTSTSNCQITSRSDTQVLVTCTPEEAGTKTLYIAPESNQSVIAGDVVRNFEILPAFTPLVAPTGINVEQIGDEFEITWGSVPGAEDYRVYISSSSVSA